MTKFISNFKKYRLFNELTQEELNTPIEKLFVFEF